MYVYQLIIHFFLFCRHFPSECFGTCIGLVLCFSGLAMVLQFAFKIMIRETFQNQFFYVSYQNKGKTFKSNEHTHKMRKKN